MSVQQGSRAVLGGRREGGLVRWRSLASEKALLGGCIVLHAVRGVLPGVSVHAGLES